jgi:uncharacterized SAM-binding protein YcdF (DUF218 family)
MCTTVLEHAARLWAYMSSARAHGPCEAIVVCCSCDLLEQGLAPRLVFTGKSGNWTRHLWHESEAEVFRARALANGVDASRIFLEDQATNFGENIAFVRGLLPDLRRVTFLTKPNSVLRVALTVPIQWPEVTAFVDSPAFSFPQEVSNVIGVFGVIHELVGDIDRIRRYPARGFQVEHRLPQPILDSWHRLVQEGFTHHLLAETKDGLA